MPSARIELNDNGNRRTLAIEKDRFTIGRRDDNDLHLGNADVSRYHAEIVLTDDQYSIRDLGSRFGTYVNGEKISEKPLRHGDRIRIGPSAAAEFTFLVGEPVAGERTTSPISAPIVGDLRQVTALLEGLRALGSGRVLDEVLGIVLDSAIDLAGAERGFVMLAGVDGKLELKLSRARGGQTLVGDGVVTSRRIPEQVFASGQPEVVTDLLDVDLEGKHQNTIAAGIRAALCVPLRLTRGGGTAVFSSDADRETIGVLYLDSRARSGFLSPVTRMAIEALSDEAAVAIENARLYKEEAAKARLEQDLQRAAEMQLSLLPPRMHARGPVEVAGNTLPCRAVGGDFFDYFDSTD